MSDDYGTTTSECVRSIQTTARINSIAVAHPAVRCLTDQVSERARVHYLRNCIAPLCWGPRAKEILGLLTAISPTRASGAHDGRRIAP
jgi:hypothetical protein